MTLITKNSQLSFEAKQWKLRSIGCIDLLKKLMHSKMQQRVTAEQAMEHEWLKSLGNFTIEKKQVKRCLNNFSNYRYIGVMQKAILVYFVTNIFSEND